MLREIQPWLVVGLTYISSIDNGNGITHGDDMPDYFRVTGSNINGSAGEFLDFHYNGWIADRRIGLEFVPTVTVDFLCMFMWMTGSYVICL
jgi:hypothetical protein